MAVRRVGTALVTTAALAVPSTALAQRTISITPAITFVHDDNVLRVRDDLKGGRRADDYRVSPSLDIRIDQPIGRQRVFLQGSVGYDFYRYNDDLERESIALTGGATIVSGRCQIGPTLTYLRRQSDLADLFIAGGRLSNTEEVLRPGVSINCNSAGGLSSGLSYEREDVSNSDGGRAFNDYSANTYGASIGLARPSIGNLSLYANHRRGVYDSRGLPGGGVEAIESTSAGIRLDRQIGRIRGQISGGITRVQSNTPGVPGFSGPSYGVALTYLGSGRITATIGGNRNVTQSNLLGVSYSITDSGYANIGYALSDRARLRAGYLIARRRFEDSPLTASVGRLNDRSQEVTGGIAVRVARRAEIDFGAIYRTRRASDPLFDYDARILALSLRFR